MSGKLVEVEVAPDGELLVTGNNAPAAKKVRPVSRMNRKALVAVIVVAVVIALVVVIVPAVVLTRPASSSGDQSNVTPTPVPSATLDPPTTPTILPANEQAVTMTGPFNFAHFGQSAASLDINSDNFSDLLIGGNGYAQLILGYGVAVGGTVQVAVPYNTTSPSSAGWTFKSDLNDGTGFSVASSDLNNDHIPDVVIGAPYYSLPMNESSVGAVYVVYGAAPPYQSPLDLPSLDGTNGFVIVGAAAYAFTGCALAGGDVNNDGVGDIIIGARNATDDYGNQRGAVYIVYGGASFPATLPAANISSNGYGVVFYGQFHEDLGFSVAISADLNKDGIGDIIMSAPMASGYSGVVYVVFGQTTFASAVMHTSAIGTTVAGFRIEGDNGNGGKSLGYSVAAGDVNGDNVPDVIMGAPYINQNMDNNNRWPGELWVYFGASSGSYHAMVGTGQFDGKIGFSLVSAYREDWFGYSVSAAGDYNQDGIADVLVGAPKTDFGTNAGAGYVVYGHTGSYAPSFNMNNFGPTDGQLLRINEDDGQMGTTVTGGFDFNGDGNADVLCAAPLADASNNRFSVGYVLVQLNRTPKK